MARFRNYFLTGLVVAGPIAITFYLTWWFVKLGRQPGPPVRADGLTAPKPICRSDWPGSGLIVAVIALTLLGFSHRQSDRTDAGRSRRKAARADSGGARDLSRPEAGVRDAVLGFGIELSPVGLVEFPSPGMWSIVLISQPPSVEIANSLPGREEHISVFLPCAPNPTTGFFFYVPKSKIVEIDMSAEDAATLIMSAGVVQPGSDPQKKIAALAATANAARVANTATLQPSPAKVE